MCAEVCLYSAVVGGGCGPGTAFSLVFIPLLVLPNSSSYYCIRRYLVWSRGSSLGPSARTNITINTRSVHGLHLFLLVTNKTLFPSKASPAIPMVCYSFVCGTRAVLRLSTHFRDRVLARARLLCSGLRRMGATAPASVCLGRGSAPILPKRLQKSLGRG